jgi:hypothetical protein
VSLELHARHEGTSDHNEAEKDDDGYEEGQVITGVLELLRVILGLVGDHFFALAFFFAGFFFLGMIVSEDNPP